MPEGFPVFTVIAFFALAGVAGLAGKSNRTEQAHPGIFSDEEVRQSIVFLRQDMKLVVYALFAILVMLGFIADKLR